jgi:flavin-dependent dehydrogenase
VSRIADVFLVGGGPAGLAAAIACRLRGMDVVVADGARPPIDKACGEGILPAGIQAARTLGISLDGAPIRGIRFHDGVTTADAAFPDRPGIGVRRTSLHEAMVARAEDLGVRLLWGSPVGNLDSIRARWIVGADGGQSRVRRWAGLDREASHRRYGFRWHCPVAPSSDRVEVHWHDGYQVYITPVSSAQISVALLSRMQSASRLLIESGAYSHFAMQLASRRGAITVMRRLRAVTRGRVALIGDASGSVDAITGEGISLAFRQAIALADALEANNLSRYEAAHARLARRPRLMAEALLLLDRSPALRHATIRAFSACPPLFASLLAAHSKVGQASEACGGIHPANLIVKERD